MTQSDYQQGMKERFLGLLQSGDAIDIDGTFIRHYEHSICDVDNDENDVAIRLAVPDRVSGFAFTFSEISGASVTNDGKTWLVGGHNIEFFAVYSLVTSQNSDISQVDMVADHLVFLNEIPLQTVLSSDEDWAIINSQRYFENQDDSRVIGFEFDDLFIVNPYMDASGIERVDPVKYYGKHFNIWLDRKMKISMAAAHANNSNS
jgi:hypothetical protein